MKKSVLIAALIATAAHAAVAQSGYGASQRHSGGYGQTGNTPIRAGDRYVSGHYVNPRYTAPKYVAPYFKRDGTPVGGYHKHGGYSEGGYKADHYTRPRRKR